MSIWSRIFAMRRSSDPHVPTDRRLPLSTHTLSGIVITADNCISVPTVWACIRYLSQTVAVLPWRVMRPVEGGGVLANQHPLDWLLNNRPAPEWSSFQFRETMLHWALRWGNGHAEIERDTMGRPVALWPIHPSRVTAMRDGAERLFYRVHNGTDSPTDIPMMDMFHVRGFGDGPVGINVAEYAAETIGWARAAQLFGAGFFGNGMNVTGVVETKRSLSQTGLDRVKAEFRRLYRGVRGDRVMWLDAGMEFKPIGIEPEKAQFLATNMYLVEEVCRIFGVPPHKVAHLLRSTNNNVESQVVEVVVDSVGPWVKRFEDEADFKLTGQNRQGLYTMMDMTALMRGDPESRANYWKVLRDIGAVNANEIRLGEGMNPIPEDEGGSKYTMQGQYTTLSMVGEQPEAPDAAGTAAAPEPPEPEDDDAGEMTPPAALTVSPAEMNGLRALAGVYVH